MHQPSTTTDNLNRMTGRRRAREVVMQVMFQTEFQPGQSSTEEQQFMASRLRRDENLIQFAQNLLAGIRTHIDHIDQTIGQMANNWSVDRMPPTDRSVLRLAAYEIIYADTPGPVAINEAVELAKRFGSEDSGKFVNGILDRLNKDQNRSVQAPVSQDRSLQ